MFEKLKGVEERFLAIEKEMSDPETARELDKYQSYVREHSELGKIVSVFRVHQKTLKDLEESTGLFQENDPEIRELARDEIETLPIKKDELELELKRLLMPRDENDDKNVIMEIRAGTGGDEAGLFASDLFRMYHRYAEKNNWKVEILSTHFTGVGGFKEVIALIQGKGAYSRLKYESGTHRVQRARETEAQGGIHTSAATVAVL